MDDVLSLLNQARLRSAALNDQLSAQFGLSPGDPPIAAFNMVNQYAIVALELLSFYNQVWTSLVPSAVSDPDQTRKENADRVITITKAAFILGLSSFEFSAKQAAANRPGRIAPIAGRVYLRKIIQESVVAGLLPTPTICLGKASFRFAIYLSTIMVSPTLVPPTRSRTDRRSR